MRPGHWLPFGTLVLLLAGCSSRGGDSLFNGEAPPQDIEDEVDAGAERDATSDDESDASDGDGESDAAIDADAGDDADQEEGGTSELPPVSISCGDAVCTTPAQYCCRPPKNVPLTSPSCKEADAECRFGIGAVGTNGLTQYCAAHADCAGGECCALRDNPNAAYGSVECRPWCQGAEVEVCDPANPQCNNGGTCGESDLVRGLYVCKT